MACLVHYSLTANDKVVSRKGNNLSFTAHAVWVIVNVVDAQTLAKLQFAVLQSSTILSRALENQEKQISHLGV